MVEIEEFFHRTVVFAFDELDIVDNQQTALLVLLLRTHRSVTAHSLQ